MERLDKILASRGVGTRTEVRGAVKRKRVTVDGEVVRDFGLKVDPAADIRFDGEPVLPMPLLVAYHKPTGILSSIGDAHGRANLEAALPPAWRGHLHPVGRLDADTSGLLLFSQDGKLTQRLLHPRRGVERAYVAQVEGVGDAELIERLAAGVSTAEGTFTANVTRLDGDVVHLTVTEGKHRMVRRMLANAGYPVVALHRVRYGAVELGDLPEGESREATPDELAWVQAL